jgi:hypothetical protein
MVVTLVAKPLDEAVFERWGRNARRLPDALVEKGVLTPEESAKIVAPFWNRTREEVVEPFGQDGVFAELKLEALAIEEERASYSRLARTSLTGLKSGNARAS